MDSSCKDSKSVVLLVHIISLSSFVRSSLAALLYKYAKLKKSRSKIISAGLVSCVKFILTINFPHDFQDENLHTSDASNEFYHKIYCLIALCGLWTHLGPDGTRLKHVFQTLLTCIGRLMSVFNLFLPLRHNPDLGLQIKLKL